MTGAAIDIQGLSHRYHDRLALNNVTLRLEAGTLFGLLGPNGSGKTTLFRILSTLMTPTEGRARVFGLDTTEESRAIRGQIGVVFQDEALDGGLTVRENLRLQGALYNLRGGNLRTHIDTVLERFEIADRADDPVDELSGGLRRRADLARGLLHEPALLLLDEPTAGLDPAARRTFWTALQRLQAVDGTTLVVATHLMEEAERCDRVGILSGGRLVADGAPESLKAELGDETIWLETDTPRGLRDRIDAQFGVSTRIVGSRVQVAPPDPPAFLASLYDALGDHIQSATIRVPTLEDVFMVHAGSSSGDDCERALASTLESGGLA